MSTTTRLFSWVTTVLARLSILRARLHCVRSRNAITSRYALCLECAFTRDNWQMTEQRVPVTMLRIKEQEQKPAHERLRKTSCISILVSSIQAGNCHLCVALYIYIYTYVYDRIAKTTIFILFEVKFYVIYIRSFNDTHKRDTKQYFIIIIRWLWSIGRITFISVYYLRPFLWKFNSRLLILKKSSL